MRTKSRAGLDSNSIHHTIIHTMVSSPVIKTTGLSYRYAKGIQTLSDIDLTVEKGSIYGFIGPNGSGKTTTLSLLLGLLKSQEGSIEIFGEHLQSNRLGILRRIGALVEVPSLYGHLTAVENLEVYRGILGVTKERVREVLETVGIADTKRKTVKKFSLGMKQRLAIALALLPGPELLILDEPSNGLDPSGIIELRQLIKRLNREHGMTILISSHLLAEIEKMVTHVGIIYQGKMLFQGSLGELQSFQQKSSKLFVKTANNDIALKILAEHYPEHSGDGITVSFKDKEEVAAINRKLTANNIDVYQLQSKEQDLEQLFIHLTSNR